MSEFQNLIIEICHFFILYALSFWFASGSNIPIYLLSANKFPYQLEKKRVSITIHLMSAQCGTQVTLKAPMLQLLTSKKDRLKLHKEKKNSQAIDLYYFCPRPEQRIVTVLKYFRGIVTDFSHLLYYLCTLLQLFTYCYILQIWSKCTQDLAVGLFYCSGPLCSLSGKKPVFIEEGSSTKPPQGLLTVHSWFCEWCCVLLSVCILHV